MIEDQVIPENECHVNNTEDIDSEVTKLMDDEPQTIDEEPSDKQVDENYVREGEDTSKEEQMFTPR